MKYSKLIFFFTLTVLLAFSSCQKEEISEMVDEPTGQVEPPVTSHSNVLVPQIQASSSSSTDGLNLGCFTIDVPFDLIADGVTITINGIDDLETALTDTVVFIDFGYPLDITYPDGTTDILADGVALGEAFASCIPDSGWNEDLFPVFLITDGNSCYEMAYPVNLVDDQGNNIVANDEGELVDLIANNPDLYFTFPFNLIDEDGNTLTAENEEELFELLILCEEVINPDTTDYWGGVNPFGDCWDFVYPFNMVDQDGNTVVINNHDDICNAMLNGFILVYTFPLTLVNSDGEELVVNNMGELAGAWVDCNTIVTEPTNELLLLLFLFQSDLDPNSGPECYSINFPLEYINNQTGEAGSIADLAGVEDYISNSSQTIGLDKVTFPVTVTATATGDQVTLEDLEAYFNFISDCQ